MPIDIQSLALTAVSLLNRNKADNYRVCILITGPPGSGKSTVAGKVCREINRSFEKFLSQENQRLADNEISSRVSEVEVASAVPEITTLLSNELGDNDGILPEHVEDVTFRPVKRQLENGDWQILGRGGLPNAFTISSGVRTDVKYPIAQVVPMDGFHLTLQCLSSFQDPQEAYRRRGSPSTFDSNNFAQLCEILVQTCDVKPQPSNCDVKSCFEFISRTYDPNFPRIYIPGFDHSLKDPIPNQFCLDGHTRIIILEGLYLLYDDENWRKAYETLRKAKPTLIWYIDIEDHIIEERVAARHFASGLSESIEQGRNKFQGNDLLNARLIRDKLIQSNDVIALRND